MHTPQPTLSPGRRQNWADSHSALSRQVVASAGGGVAPPQAGSGQAGISTVRPASHTTLRGQSPERSAVQVPKVDPSHSSPGAPPSPT